jgi:hypothetical protein
MSCFCIDKIQKKIRLAFLLTVFDSVESLEFWPGIVRSNTVLAVKRTSAFSSIVVYLRSPDMPLRASVRPCSNKQCSATFGCTSLAFERTCRVYYIYVAAIDHRSCAQAHLSCCSSRPEAGMCSVLCFFLFYLFIYFILPMFIYLLVVFVS